MAFKFDADIGTIVVKKNEEEYGVVERTTRVGTDIADMIKEEKKNDPDSLIIDFNKYNDGKKYWSAVVVNVIAALEEAFRGRITATNYIDPDWLREAAPVWTGVKQGDGCSDRYVKIVFIKE